MNIIGLQQYWLNKLGSFGENLLNAGLLLIVGWWLSKLLTNIVVKMMKKSNIDGIIISFLKSMLEVALKVIVIIMVVGALGVNTTSLVAVLTTGGAAIVLGLKDSATGVVSGMTILFSKPFSKGDMIEVNGYTGKVMEIQMLYTILLTLDNKRVIIPNNELASSVIINYSFEETRRVDLTIDVHYSTDIEKAKQVIKEVVLNDSKALKDNEPYIRVSEYKDSSISIAVKVWCSTEDYYNLKADLLEEIKEAFDRNNIEMAYPQLDVHMKN
jgi:small conductance mechanosensitive channel